VDNEDNDEKYSRAAPAVGRVGKKLGSAALLAPTCATSAKPINTYFMRLYILEKSDSVSSLSACMYIYCKFKEVRVEFQCAYFKD